MKQLKEELQTGLAVAFGFPHADGDGVSCRSRQIMYPSVSSHYIQVCPARMLLLLRMGDIFS